MNDKKPFIARDTGSPLIVFGAHEVNERGGLIPQSVDTSTDGDYGADPLGDGTFRMVPSGDVVDYTERCRRLRH